MIGKRILVTTLLLAMTGMAAIAQAAVTVDFSAIGSGSMDITDAGYSIDGVTFGYDNFGDAAYSAAVDSHGVSGSTYGLLTLDFEAPVDALNFDFAIRGTSRPDGDALFITFKNGAVETDASAAATFVPQYPGNPAGVGDAFGTLAYSGGAFDQASMLFAYDPSLAGGQIFTVNNLSYEPVSPPIPEPSSLLCEIFGLLGICGRLLIVQKQ